ncbi:MAG: ABC transporter permease [Pseudoclavibacter sp.]
MIAAFLHYGRLLLTSLLLFLAVITALFLLLELSPGDPVQSLVGQDVAITPEFRAQLTAQFGLDLPLWERYVVYVGNVLTGNLGISFGTQVPVLDLIMSRIGNTIALALPAFLLSTAGGLIIGAIAARTRKRWLDGLLSGGAVIFFSVPNFWLGIMLITLFSVVLGWLPSQGMGDGYGSSNAPAIQYMILPVFTMASTELAYKARIMRSSMIEALGQDYIDAARSKGVSSSRLLWRHALPNALLPMITVSGYSLGLLLAGSILIERVFGWPGMGLLLFDAIERQNNMVVLGVTVVMTIVILIVNFLTDVTYGLVDPRLRARFSRRVRSGEA